jgi:hypothetical protein
VLSCDCRESDPAAGVISARRSTGPSSRESCGTRVPPPAWPPCRDGAFSGSLVPLQKLPRRSKAVDVPSARLESNEEGDLIRVAGQTVATRRCPATASNRAASLCRSAVFASSLTGLSVAAEGLATSAKAEVYHPLGTRLWAPPPAVGRCVEAGAVLHRPGRAYETRLGLSRPFPRTHRSESNRVGEVRSLAPGSTRTMGWSLRRESNAGYELRRLVSGSARTKRCARSESSRVASFRRAAPGSARTSATRDADASCTRPRGFAIRAHRWVPASQSGQRVTLPPCLSGTQASSLSDWPHRSGRRESLPRRRPRSNYTLHRVGSPRSGHQTAPATEPTASAALARARYKLALSAGTNRRSRSGCSKPIASNTSRRSSPRGERRGGSAR